MSKDLVLLTGATGHLGFRTLIFALQDGFKARVTLRRLEQAEILKKTASLQPFLEDVEFVHVPDITTDHAYDEVIKGVDYVIHIASPIYSGFGPEEKDWKRHMYDPAEKGALSILSAAAKEPKVKRVVITSSVVVLESKNGAKRAGPYDLKDLPPQQVLDNAPFMAAAYVMSKVLAHRRSTEFVEQNKVHFDLIRVLPAYIQGANELYQSPEEMRNPAAIGSNEGTIRTMLGMDPQGPRITSQVFLDDVAKAHVVPLKATGIANLSNILVSGNGGDPTPWKDIAELIEKLYPDAVKNGTLQPAAKGDEMGSHFDVASSEKALGFEFAGPEAYVKSVVDQYLALSAA